LLEADDEEEDAEADEEEEDAEAEDDEEEEDDEEDEDDEEAKGASATGGERARPRRRPAMPPATLLVAAPACAYGLKGFRNCVGSAALASARRWSSSFARVRASLVTGT
jgi:hypothetical protein